MSVHLLIVEDNQRLRQGLAEGLNHSEHIEVIGNCSSGEATLDFVPGLAEIISSSRQAAVLLDVQLEGAMNGIETAVALRRELPRFPVVFYSIQDDDSYFRAFRQAQILSHYAYVRKSNFLLPEMIWPLIRDAVAGRSYIDSAIERRVQEVRQLDERDPLALLEPNEKQVALMLAEGLTNGQIATRMGYRDKRTISRVNGQIYAVWGLKNSTTDEKIARTRAALIVQRGVLLEWDEGGQILE
jgi:DNA-binding NarL/FixJ family response regulator